MADHRSTSPGPATAGWRRVRSAPLRRQQLAWALSAVAVLVTAACAGPTGSAAPASSAATPAGPALINGTTIDRAIPASVLDLPFVDAAGRAVNLASLHGRTLVVADFLTTCQEICPMTSVNVRDLADALIKAGQPSVTLLEITVDPERDDPSRLAAYRALFGAPRPNWIMLSGTSSSVAALWKFLGVGYFTTPPASPAPTDWLSGRPLTYDVSHQNVVIVIDGQGHERWLVTGTPATNHEDPPPTLKSFLSQDGRQNLSSPEGPVWTTSDVLSALARVTGQPIG